MNPNLKNLDDDFLYHLGYSKSDGLDALFGDVKVKPSFVVFSVYTHLFQPCIRVDSNALEICDSNDTCNSCIL